MQTYSHAFSTWVATRYGLRATPAAATYGAFGAVLPDVPAFAGTACLWKKRRSMSYQEFWDTVHFLGSFGRAGTALHSVIPVVLLLLIQCCALERRDGQRPLLWLLIGWMGHNIIDFLTHVDDARPQFWPLSRWKWRSRVSYWDPLYHGRLFFLVEHAALLLTALWLLQSREGERSFDRQKAG